MATVTPILRAPKARPDGHAPIWLRFTNAHRSTYLSLGVYVHPRHWNPRKHEVRKGHPNSERINALIARRLAEAEDERLRLLTDREPVTLEALRSALSPTTASGADRDCFIAYVDRFLVDVATAGNVRRVRREKVVLKKLRDFAAPGEEPLPFSRITPSFLREFEAHLIGVKKNKASTVHANVGVIKIHFRRAISEGVVSREVDPFFSYSPGRVAKPDRAKLTLDQLRGLERLEFESSGPGASLDSRTRDAFLFSLYGAGIRFGDLAELRVGDIGPDAESGGALRLSYRMSKNGKRVAVLVPGPAIKIAERFMVDEDGRPKHSDEFLFGLLDGYDLSTPEGRVKAIASQNTLTNKSLKRLAKRVTEEGTPMPEKLTFHIARHSFADLARKNGWDVYAISKALAHSGLGITENYLAGFDSDALDTRLSGLFGLPEPVEG